MVRWMLVGLVFAPALVQAQTFAEYLKLRKTHDVTRPADPAALDVFVGKRVVEIRGTVTGVIGGSDGEILLLAGDAGRQYLVRTDDAPDWLKGNAVPARLLIQAERSNESAQLQARLIGAASEGTMRTHEAKAAPAPVTTQRASSRTSRSGGRPSPLPMGRRDVPSATVKSALPAQLVAVLPQYAAFVLKQNPRLGQEKAHQIAETILAFSAHYGVDARLIMAIVLCESGFDPGARSHAGAMGLGQLMPGTARGLGISNAYDTQQNLYGTVRLVRGHIERYTAKTGDSFEGLVLALAAYNAGSGAVRKFGGVPPYRETQNYVRKVVETYAKLCGR